MSILKIKIKGNGPILLHNNQAVDPLNSYTKLMKKFTSKRLKTDEDLIELSRIEWESGLYFNNDNELAMPTQNIHSMLNEAAKKNKRGKLIKEGLIIEEEYVKIILREKFVKNPHQTPDPALNAMFDKYADRRVVKLSGKSSLLRTRPRFNVWELDPFTILYDDNIVSQDELIETMQVAQERIGLGDYRPRYGKFTFKVV